MKRCNAKEMLTDALCIAGAIGFTLMGYLVQLEMLTSYAFVSGAALILFLSAAGLVCGRDWKAFTSASVIAGAAMLAFGTLALSHDTPLDADVAGRVKTALTAFPAFWVFLSGWRMGMRSISRPSSNGCTPVCAAVVTALYTIVALLLCWQKWYPSGVSPDVTQQWAQIHGELKLNDIHALGHTLFLKALTCIWDDRAMIIAVHILMIALLYALFAYDLAVRGVRLSWMLLAVSLFTACESPATAYFYPWKDTPYTFAVGILTLLLIQLVDGRREFAVAKALILGVALAFTTLFRFNGVVVLLFVGAYVTIWFIRRRLMKQLIAMAASAILCFTGVNWYGYHVLKAESPENGFSIQVFASGLAAMVTQPGSGLTSEERAEIAQYLDIHWMEEHYVPWETRKLIWDYPQDDPEGIFDDPNMKINANSFVVDSGKHKKEIVALYFRLMPRHWAVCVRDVLYNTYAVWGLERGAQGWYSNILLLVLLLTGVGACWKKGSRAGRLIVFAPVICNAISIAISSITNETRYLLPTHTLFPVLLLYLISTSDRFASEKTEMSLRRS